MKLWAIPVVVAGALMGAPGFGSNEPSERAMQIAFEDALSLQVRNALEFAAENGGPEALATIRENGTDMFTVSAFRKLKCRQQGAHDHRCDFHVDLDLSNGRFERTISGRFVGDADDLRYQQDI
jgi:hypothetical protein